MKNRGLKKVTGKWLKDCYRWLVEHDEGCCRVTLDMEQ